MPAPAPALSAKNYTDAVLEAVGVAEEVRRVFWTREAPELGGRSPEALYAAGGWSLLRSALNVLLAATIQVATEMGEPQKACDLAMRLRPLGITRDDLRAAARGLVR